MNNRTLKTAKRPKLFKNYLRMYRAGGWLRQLVCFPKFDRTHEGEYARDICRRCGKVTMRYVSG